LDGEIFLKEENSSKNVIEIELLHDVIPIKNGNSFEFHIKEKINEIINFLNQSSDRR
jgi:hypothetical protein